MNERLYRIGSFWKSKTSNGENYLSGDALGVRLLVFKNKHKKSERSADYVLYMSAGGQKEPKSQDETPESEEIL